MMTIAVVVGVLLPSSGVCFGIGAELIKSDYQLLTTLQLTPSIKKLMLFAGSRKHVRNTAQNPR